MMMPKMETSNERGQKIKNKICDKSGQNKGLTLHQTLSPN
jgi:hypothetical protein